MDWGNWLEKDEASGALVIEGTDVPLSAIRDLWASGQNFRDVPRIYPTVTQDRAESAFHMFNTNTFE